MVFYYLKIQTSIWTCLLIFLLCCNYVSATNLPDGVFGISRYDYFTECLPPQTKGVYKILAANNMDVKYVGSSLDINKRLANHHKNGVLEKGDMIEAIIFRTDVMQSEIRDYERVLVKGLSPSRNKHPGAPGRPWRADQMLKLKLFYDHNKPLLTPQGQLEIKSLLTIGKRSSKDYKLMRGLFKLLKLF